MVRWPYRARFQPRRSARRGRSALSASVPRSFILIGVGTLAGLLMHSVAARRLGAHEYGMFSYAHSAASLLVLLAGAGWPAGSLRFGAQYADRCSWGLLNGLITRSHQVVFAMSGVTAVAAATVAYVVRGSVPLSMCAGMAAAMVPVMAVGSLRAHLLRGLGHVAESVVVERIAVPLAVWVCLLGTRATTATGAVVIWLIVGAASRAVETVRMRAVVRSLTGTTDREYRTREWMGVAGRVLVGEMGRATLGRADVLMLGALADMSSVAVYGLAKRLCLLIALTLAAVNTAAAPMLASAYHGGRKGEFLRLFRRARLWSIVGASPVFAIIMVAPDPLMGLFGADYRGHATAVRIIAAGMWLNACTGPVAMTLVMTGRERRYGLAVLVAAVCSIGANSYIIPRWGVVGAACVGSVGAAALNGWLALSVSRVT